jgi:hypothetical protein
LVPTRWAVDGLRGLGSSSSSACSRRIAIWRFDWEEPRR